jgi:membrane fusion protein, multidrug efflux system
MLLGYVNCYAQQEEHATYVKVIKPTIGEISKTIKLVGTVSPRKSMIIFPEIDGKIKSIHFKDNDKVAKDTILFVLEDGLLKAEVNKIKAKLSFSKPNYERAVSAFSQGTSSQKILDEAKARYLEDKAELEIATLKFNQTLIKAPFAGQVGYKKVQVGERVTAATKLIELFSTPPHFIKFDLSENFLSHDLKTMFFDAKFNNIEQVIRGHIEKVGYKINESGKKIKLLGKLDADINLYPGQTSKITLYIEHKPKALLIPKSCLVYTDDGLTVFKVVDNIAKQITIETGLSKGRFIEVLSGLTVDDQIVSVGTFKVYDDNPVKIIGD